ncbi:MAG: 50S ribosomal protein L35 [Gammaproteobacteria bacterium]
MPKAKSHSGAAKRFKATKGGIKFRRKNRAHILTKKANKRKRQLRANGMLNKVDMPAVERMLTGS